MTCSSVLIEQSTSLLFNIIISLHTLNYGYFYIQGVFFSFNTLDAAYLPLIVPVVQKSEHFHIYLKMCFGEQIDITMN